MNRPSHETYNKMVDLVLASNGTPRHHLYEYPHRADDSDRMIAKAKQVVDSILRLANESE